MNRFFEILPGALSWGTIIAMFFVSWLFPVQTAVFIILFDIYFFLRTLHFAIHLGFGYREMKKSRKENWLQKLKELPGRNGKKWGDIYHLVIFPMYKESYSVVKESFDSFLKINYPLDRFIVVLTGEEKGGEETRQTIKRIEDEYGDKFFRMLTTIHPTGLPDETPGKGSNETWGAKQAKAEIIDKENIPYENILVSTFDVDTQVFPEYFARLTYAYFTAEHPDRSSYQPVTLFTNNTYEAPIIARLAAFSTTFWNIMSQVRPEKLITFSSHSMPFKALVEIGFWTKTYVSEDSLIFWQCFLHYNGDWRVVPLHYPVSMDANVASTFWHTMRNIYKQQRRWAWGCENIPFVFCEFVRNKKIALKKKLYWAFQLIELNWSWATSAFIILLLGRLPLLLGGDKFNTTVLSYNLPQLTSNIINIAIIGSITSAILSIAILPPKPEGFRWYHYPLFLLQWVLLPINLIAFSAIPAIDAQTRLMMGGKLRLGFWVTPKARKGEKLRE